MRIAHVDFRMPQMRPKRKKRSERYFEVLTGTTLAIALIAAFLAPAPVRLIVLSIILLAAGFGSAIVAYLRGDQHDAHRFTLWDQAGLLVFIGFAAAILADDTSWVPYVNQMIADRSTVVRQ